MTRRTAFDRAIEECAENMKLHEIFCSVPLRKIWWNREEIEFEPMTPKAKIKAAINSLVEKSMNQRARDHMENQPKLFD